MEIICINALFSSDTLEFFEKHGVITPELDSFYSVRDIIINSNGQTGILLNEIINPKISVEHPLLGIALMETNWNLRRFKNIDGTEIDSIELQQELKIKTYV